VGLILINERKLKILLKEIEIKIIRFIHEFGFCEINQIIRRFELKESTTYRYMKKLVRLGLVANTRIIQYQPRAYYVTSYGATFLSLDLPVIRRIPLNVYEHQLLVISIFIKLRKLNPDATWITERRISRDINDSNNKKHLPDGALVFPDSKQYAIEVEKTPKTKKRLEKILLQYGLQITYKEAWYFCSKSLVPSVSKIAKDLPYIKVFRLEEYL